MAGGLVSLTGGEAVLNCGEALDKFFGEEDEAA